METPRPLAVAKKDTRKLIRELQKIPIDGEKLGEGEADAQGPGGRRTRRQPIGTCRGMGHLSRPEGRVSGVGMVGAGRGSKGASHGITPGLTGTWAQVEASKRGSTVQGEAGKVLR